MEFHLVDIRATTEGVIKYPKERRGKATLKYHSCPIGGSESIS